MKSTSPLDSKPLHMLCLVSLLNQAQDKKIYTSVDSWLLPERVELWAAPDYNCFKVNIDAGTFEKESRYGFGGIIRDHKGQFVAAISGLKEGRVLAEIAEAIALKEVLSWIKEARLNVQYVETDSLVLVQAFKSAAGVISALEDWLRIANNY